MITPRALNTATGYKTKGDPLRTNPSAINPKTSMASKGFTPHTEGRVSGFAKMDPTNAGYKIVAMTMPIPLPVSKRNVLDGTYKRGRLGKAFKMGGIYKYEFRPSIAYIRHIRPRINNTRLGGKPERLRDTTAWKINPIMAPTYCPVQRAHNGNC